MGYTTVNNDFFKGIVKSLSDIFSRNLFLSDLLLSHCFFSLKTLRSIAKQKNFFSNFSSLPCSIKGKLFNRGKRDKWGGEAAHIETLCDEKKALFLQYRNAFMKEDLTLHQCVKWELKEVNVMEQIIESIQKSQEDQGNCTELQKNLVLENIKKKQDNGEMWEDLAKFHEEREFQIERICKYLCFE